MRPSTKRRKERTNIRMKTATGRHDTQSVSLLMPRINRSRQSRYTYSTSLLSPLCLAPLDLRRLSSRELSLTQKTVTRRAVWGRRVVGVLNSVWSPLVL